MACSNLSLNILLILCIFLHGALTFKTTVNAGMKSFSHAVKEGRCVPGKEIELLSERKGAGVITEQWFAGYGYNDKTIITYYIDDDPSLTIQGNLYMMIANGHGLLNMTDNDKANFNDTKSNNYGIPWGTRRFGHITENGGMYLTIRFPYNKIRITAQFDNSGYFWYIVRGVNNYPVIVGDLKLPSEARLKLYKRENIVLKPLEYVNLALNNNSSGLIYLLSFSGKSENFHYLEGCFRLVTDGEDVQYLSSGTEDMFLSAYYFSSGLYHTEQSGLSIKKLPGTISAYKYFADDPLLFSKDFMLIWRNGEIHDNKCFADHQLEGVEEKCVVFEDGTTMCKSFQPLDESYTVENIDNSTPYPSLMNLATYVWVYEW